MDLNVGTLASGKPFHLPADLGDVKIALLAMSKVGKTYGLGDILEELVRRERPFIAIDPANNFWGLRVLPDGSPSGLPVVVIGGDHGDIQFDRDSGDRIADSLMSTPVCAVIDTTFESVGTVRRFMTSFADRLMRSGRVVPERLIVLEEAPVLIPQKAFGPQMNSCKSSVSKLATVGGNFGFGVIAASQRAATIDKDVLTQCEALIVMRMTAEKDRETVRDWIQAKDLGGQVEKMFRQLGSLKDGEAFLWWPTKDRFERFTFRKRHTLHPREMKLLKLRSSDIRLGDSVQFVETLKRQLSKTQVSVPEAPPRKRREKPFEPYPFTDEHSPRTTDHKREEYEKTIKDLKEAVAHERGLRVDAEKRLAVVRTSLKPQYDSLSTLFNLTKASNIGSVDRGLYNQWLEKAPKSGIKKMLEYLLEHGEATRTQLATIAGVTPRSAYDYVGWLVRNGLARPDGKSTIKLKDR